MVSGEIHDYVNGLFKCGWTAGWMSEVGVWVRKRTDLVCDDLVAQIMSEVR